MIKRTSLALALSCIAASAHARDIAFTGFLHVPSLPVCSILPGAECINYLAVDAPIERYCRDRPTGAIRVLGHSMGGGAATTFVKALAACGLKVDAVALFDPMIHPFDMPAGTRVIVFYSASSAGIGEGHPDAIFVGGDHISMTGRPDIRERARAFLTPRRMAKGKKP